jgi:hypothetical protein
LFLVYVLVPIIRLGGAFRKHIHVLCVAPV